MQPGSFALRLAGIFLVLCFLFTRPGVAQEEEFLDIPEADTSSVTEPPDLAAPQLNPTFLKPFTYRMVGPHRGGRVTAVAGSPGPLPTLYMGATGGGVWRSRNHGISYENVSDGYFEVGSIGAIGVSPADSNIVLVGTGSASIRSNVSTGRGVYRSLDGGDSWDFAGLRDTGQIGSIAMHPEKPEVAYLAALGQAFGPNPDRGVYRTRDGGETWEQVLFVSDSTGAVSLAIDPENPDILFAGMWRGERKPWTIISGSTEGGVFKSEDAGDTWAKLKNGLPEGIVGKMDIAISPQDPSRVFVLIEAEEGKGGLYRSDDGGDSFQRVSEQKNLLNRPFYYTYITADPHDKNTIYVNNESFFRSTDGGVTFETIRTPHGDHHDLWINPDQKDYLFQGNDGGATVSLDGGKTWSSILNQATAELYHVVVDNQVPYFLYGEQQDNSTIRVPSLPPSAYPAIDSRQNWLAVAGCETGPLAVHPTKPNIIYGGCKGRFSRFNTNTGQDQQYWVYPHFNYGHSTSEMPYRFQRTSPIEISPHDPSVIYHTSQYVHRTTNEGRNWEVISPDLTANEPDKQMYSGGPITRDITGEEIYSAIYQLRESPLQAGVLWAGSNDGLIHVSTDNGATWENVTPADLPPGGRVQTIDPSWHEPGRAYIAVYRYMLNDWEPYLYKTEDFGATWERLTDGNNGIPVDAPTRVIREDPDREGLLYAGTEFGMFLSIDDGISWQPFQQNLPHTPITDIRVHNKDLVLSTMGRSFWILDDISPLHHLDSATQDQDAILFPPRDLVRMRWMRGPVQFDGANPEYPPFGITLYYSIPDGFESDVHLDILDGQRRVVKSFSPESESPTETQETEQGMRGVFEEPFTEARLSLEPGLHKVTWDLRYPGPDPGARTEEGMLTRTDASDGPLALPGSYSVRMRVDLDTTYVPFRLEMDERIAADGITPADLEAQFLFIQRLDTSLSALYRTVNEVRHLRGLLANTLSDTTLSETHLALADTVQQTMDAIENALIQTGTGKIGAQLQPKMMRQFTYLRGMLSFADQPPGEDAYLRLTDLERLLRAEIDRYRELDTVTVEALNDALLDVGKRPVTLPKN